jgi:hypothetical protein
MMLIADPERSCCKYLIPGGAPCRSGIVRTCSVDAIDLSRPMIEIARAKRVFDAGAVEAERAGLLDRF